MSDEKIIRFPGAGGSRRQGAASSKAEKGAKGELGEKRRASALGPAAGGAARSARALRRPAQGGADRAQRHALRDGRHPPEPRAAPTSGPPSTARPADLRNAQASLDSVIARAYVRKGV